jgi:hypothetical protein
MSKDDNCVDLPSMGKVCELIVSPVDILVLNHVPVSLIFNFPGPKSMDTNE